MGNVIVCDLDGCLNYYPKCFLNWVKDKFHVEYTFIKEMQESMSEDSFKKIKLEYRTSGVKRHLPVRRGAIKLLRYFKYRGWQVNIITTRPTFSPVKEDTLYWLNRFDFDVVEFVEDKYEYVRVNKDNILFVVEDERKVAISIADLGINVFLFGVENYRNITSVKSWFDIEGLV